MCQSQHRFKKDSEPASRRWSKALSRSYSQRHPFNARSPDISAAPNALQPSGHAIWPSKSASRAVKRRPALLQTDTLWPQSGCRRSPKVINVRRRSLQTFVRPPSESPLSEQVSFRAHNCKTRHGRLLGPPFASEWWNRPGPPSNLIASSIAPYLQRFVNRDLRALFASRKGPDTQRERAREKDRERGALQWPQTDCRLAARECPRQ